MVIGRSSAISIGHLTTIISRMASTTEVVVQTTQINHHRGMSLMRFRDITTSTREANVAVRTGTKSSKISTSRLSIPTRITWIKSTKRQRKSQ